MGQADEPWNAEESDTIQAVRVGNAVTDTDTPSGCDTKETRALDEVLVMSQSDHDSRGRRPRAVLQQRAADRVSASEKDAQGVCKQVWCRYVWSDQ